MNDFLGKVFQAIDDINGMYLRVGLEPQILCILLSR